MTGEPTPNPLRAVVLPVLAETDQDEPAAQPGRLSRLRWPGRAERARQASGSAGTRSAATGRAAQAETQAPAPSGSGLGEIPRPMPGDGPTTMAPASAAGTSAAGLILPAVPTTSAGSAGQTGPVQAAGHAGQRAAPARRPRHATSAAVAPHAGRGKSRQIRIAVAALAAGGLIGPLVYAFTTGSGTPSPQSAAVPVIGVAQPWPEDSAAGITLPGDPSPTPDPSHSASLSPAQQGTGETVPAQVLGSSPMPAQQAKVSPVQTGSQALAPPAVATTAPPKATSTRISGVGCANDNTQNWYPNDMDSRWSEKAGGAGGCGRALAMPMSGDASYDTTAYVVWWFTTGPVVTGSCAISVYIPSTGIAGDVAGRPAYYKVLGGRTSSTVNGRFTIDQTVNRGRWVNAGTYQVRNGEISVHLANRGSNPNGERMGAAQVRLSCTAA